MQNACKMLAIGKMCIYHRAWPPVEDSVLAVDAAAGWGVGGGAFLCVAVCFCASLQQHCPSSVCCCVFLCELQKLRDSEN